MSRHIYSGSGAPNFTPSGIGHHYVDTTAKVSYISVGTASDADWETSDAAAAIAAHLAAGDPHPQYLTAAEGAAAYDPLGAADAKVADAITDGVTNVAPSQNAVFDALAGKAAASHTHALGDLTQSGATSGQLASWNGSAWVPVDPPNSAVWGGITGTLSDQADLQAALDAKQATIAGNDSRIVYKDNAGVVKSFDAMTVNAKNGIDTQIDDTFADSEPHTIQSEYYGLKPSEDAPATTINLRNVEASIDPDDSGFDFGTGGNAVNMLANFFRAEGTGDVGALAFLNNNFSLGDGTNPISVRGVAYAFGFGEIRSGVTMNGPLQGYGFQPIVRAGATMDPSTSYATAFYDNMAYEGDASYHTSFQSGVTIENLPTTKNITGFNFNPNIDTIETGAGVTGANIGGTYGTFDGTSYWQGININPVITEARYATGINVTMDNVTPYAGVNASVTIQDLTFEFLQPGSFNNSYTIEFVDDGTAGAETVTIAGQAIEVHIEAGVSTATQVKAACDGTPTFLGAVSTTISGTGSNAQVAEGPTNFANGEDAGRVLAGYFDGDVEITGGLTFGGSLSIGKLNAFGVQTIVDGGGNPTSIHTLITQPTVAANETLTSGDTIAVNTAALINIGDNATVGTTFIGLAALGLPAVLSMGSGATLDRCYAALFALSLDAGGGGGTVDEMGLCRAVAIPNGVTTVNKLKGFLFDLPFGDPGTDTWGVYVTPQAHNFMAGDLKIGGSDIVASVNVALEIESTSKALLLSRMDTTSRDAMTAIAGMVIFNTTTSTMQYFNGTIWV